MSKTVWIKKSPSSERTPFVFVGGDTFESQRSLLSASYLIHEASQAHVSDFDSLEEDATYLYGPSPNQYNPGKLDDFTLEHIERIKKDEDWVDVGQKMPFHGRHHLTKSVQAFIDELNLRSPPNSPNTPPVKQTTDDVGPYVKAAKALVYSSVSGSGKTISLLELKRTLNSNPDNESLKIAVAYLGFNTGLDLTEEEAKHIADSPKYHGLQEVLARRLAASTIISMNNPEAISELPRRESVYDGFKVPTVKESMELLLQYTKATKQNPIYIVAGVDEVQALNQTKLNDGVGYGQFFLRTLREWQYAWFKFGIRIVPLGTGIAIDWEAEPTSGMNVPLTGDDNTLINKDDFHQLVERVVKEVDFKERFSTGTKEETVVDLLTAAYWPRVRLLEWWRDKKTDFLQQSSQDISARGSWLVWLSHWLRDETMTWKDGKHIPGKGSSNGKIHCLFQLTTSENFSVIPDGYSLRSMVETLTKELPVKHLYSGLNVITTLDPKECMLRDCYEFENLGFRVLALAIHVGLYALSGAGIKEESATEVQKKRLGLALWFFTKGAVFEGDQKLIEPKLLGPFDSTSKFPGDFYPFDSTQTSFQEKFLKDLRNAEGPVFVRCGRRTYCDYMYLYYRTNDQNERNFMCSIVVAKHTNRDRASGHSQGVTSDDQEGVFSAACNLKSAMENAELELAKVRLLILTNRSRCVQPKKDSFIDTRNQARTLFGADELELEVLNKDSFELGPLTDVLWARRQAANRKRKHDEATET